MTKTAQKERLPSFKEDLASLPARVRAALEDLPPQEQRFVVYYCGQANGNGVKAAELAKAGKSYGTQAARASQMLRTPRVRAVVDVWMEAFAMTAAEVTARLADLARANLEPFLQLTKRGRLELRTLDADTWAACRHWVKSVDLDPKTGAVVSVTLHDSLAALRELAKILKLYSDAPVTNTFNVYLQQLDDDQLLAEYQAIKADPRRLTGKVA